MIKVSYSMLSSYMDCPQKFNFNYIQGLRLKKPEKPLFFGSDFHKLLQYKHKPKELKKAFTSIEETYNDMPMLFQAELGDNYIEDLKTIFEDYCEVWQDTETPIETEHEFFIPIGKYKGEEVVFHGIIDELYGDGVIGEHKTFNRTPDMGTLAMNTQVCLYAKAVELEKKEKIHRVRWNYIKSSPSEHPIWLEKSQRFSDAKSNKITPMSWRRACESKGISDKQILDKAVKYSPNISNFFFRCETELVPDMINTVWSDFKQAVKDLISRRHTNRVKHITRNCGWCKFRPICYAEFTGADTDYVISTDYTIKDRKDVSI